MSRMLTVRDLMTEEVVTVPPRTSLASVQELMLERNFRHVPVVDDDLLVGLISQRDLAAFLGRASRSDLTEQQLKLSDVPASRAMTTGIETIEPEENLRTAAEILLENKYGCLPVVEGARLVGILTEADFVRFVATRLGAE